MILEKMSCRLISRGKKDADRFLGKKYPARKKISLMTYNAEKKSYTVICWGKISNSREVLACRNIRFSSLFATGDVSRGETSVTQRFHTDDVKFHTDDVKSVRNPVRSADWSTE